jgi:5-methylcytosine-specific restriction endonuclease McrA
MMRKRQRLAMLGGRVATASIASAPVLTTRWQRPTSAELAAIRRQIVRRSGGWCECTPCRQSGHPLPAEEFDHLIPLWEGGGNGLENWQHLNRQCHLTKSATEARRRLGID